MKFTNRRWGTNPPRFVTLLVLGVIVFFPGIKALEVTGGEQVLVITTTTPSSSKTLVEVPESGDGGDGGHKVVKRSAGFVQPEMYFFRVEADIKYRYSTTRVTSRLANKNLDQAQEVTMTVVLPDTAFISKFVMEIDGQAYTAYVKEKEEAKQDYMHAQTRGHSAGLIEKSTRNANMFHVNVNIKAGSKVTFNLTYEELLSRRLGFYEQIININPDHQFMAIKDYKIIVNIEESEDLAFVRVPSLSNEINDKHQPDIIQERPSSNKAHLFWSPHPSNYSVTAKANTSGQFILQYDILRPDNSGQVLLMQGYFVHFFAPDNLTPLRKHIVFILDTSGSMGGRKMEQMKESQLKILDDLLPHDFFNIIPFSTNVELYQMADAYQDNQPIAATYENILQAKVFIQTLVPGGSTNIHGALIKALELTQAIKSEQRDLQLLSSTPKPISGQVVLPPNVQSLIIFLTDGQATHGVTTNNREIQKMVREANQVYSTPIFSLGFGEGVDFPFLKQLSLQNNGFARKIYEAADAALQLKDFYREIANPLLSNVTFHYTSSQYNVTDLTVNWFPTVFGGTEIAVAGKVVGVAPDKALGGGSCNFEKTGENLIAVDIQATGREGEIDLGHVPVLKRPGSCVVDIPSGFEPPSNGGQFPVEDKTPEDNFLERLWAYLTIQQLIEKDMKELEDNPGKKKKAGETPKQRALYLALQYGFVTPLTSLVVVKPNSSDLTNAESADKLKDFLMRGGAHNRRRIALGAAGSKMAYDTDANATPIMEPCAKLVTFLSIAVAVVATLPIFK